MQILRYSISSPKVCILHDQLPLHHPHVPNMLWALFFSELEKKNPFVKILLQLGTWRERRCRFSVLILPLSLPAPYPATSPALTFPFSYPAPPTLGRTRTLTCTHNTRTHAPLVALSFGAGALMPLPRAHSLLLTRYD